MRPLPPREPRLSRRRRRRCGSRAAPSPHLARSWLPARGFLSSDTILGRVIAGDLPSEPLTLRHGRPHLRSLPPEPHRPRPPVRSAAGRGERARWGAAGGCFLTSEGCPGASRPESQGKGQSQELFWVGDSDQSKASPGSRLSTVAWGWGWGAGEGQDPQLKAPRAETGRWGLVPAPKYPPPPSQRERGWGEAEGLSALTQGDSKCRQNYHSESRAAFIAKRRQLGAPGLSWLTYPAGGETPILFAPSFMGHSDGRGYELEYVQGCVASHSRQERGARRRRDGGYRPMLAFSELS